MFTIPEWPKCSPEWTSSTLDYLIPQKVTLGRLQENSEAFPRKLPIETVRCKTLIKTIPKEVLEGYINSAYPVLHENVLALYCNFLDYKRKFGDPPERQLYANMTLLQFIQRLLIQRAVIFAGPEDGFLLLDGYGGYGNWEIIGTVEETEELNLRKCLSYDEIKLSAFLSISSYTNFINDGNRFNKGITNRANVEPEGIILGLIGTRLVRPNVMEYEEIIITEEQNDEKNGYGTQPVPNLHTLFADFYGEDCFTYKQALNKKMEDPSRFLEEDQDVLFDKKVYSKRLALSIDTLLVEANHRARERNTTAFVHLVGIGLGVWIYYSHQNVLFVEIVAKRIQALGKNLHSVSDIVLAYISEDTTIGGYKDGDIIDIPGHPKNGIKIHISKREPHVKLSGEDEGKLLVVTFAWDGNALPGNEFWCGNLDSSGDPAAASSTQVAELHNPHINPKVCAENLHIVASTGVVPFEQYKEKIRGLRKRKREDNDNEDSKKLILIETLLEARK